MKTSVKFNSLVWLQFHATSLKASKPTSPLVGGAGSLLTDLRSTCDHLPDLPENCVVRVLTLRWDRDCHGFADRFFSQMTQSC